jgi:hypothetical protein
VCGCDVLCSDISKAASESRPVFLELNAGPGLRLHTYPHGGTPRNVAAAIFDYLIAQRMHARRFRYDVHKAKEGKPAPSTPPPAAAAAAGAAAAAAKH